MDTTPDNNIKNPSVIAVKQVQQPVTNGSERQISPRRKILKKNDEELGGEVGM